MDIKKLREIIEYNMKLDPNDDSEQEKCWQEMAEILSENIEDTMSYFRDNCTDEEFFWLGAVFEDIAKKTQSKEFISTLSMRLAKVSLENYNQENFKSEHMKKWIDHSEYMRELVSDIEYAESQIIVNL